MASKTSTLTMQLVDNVSKPARSVAEALQQADKRMRDVARSMAGAGATDRFVASLAKLKLSAKDVQAVSAAWKDYAKSASLAGDASNWTKAQVAGVRAWERQTIDALRSVKREQQQFHRAAAAAQAQARPARDALGRMAVAAGGLAVGYRARDFGRKSIVGAAEFDIGVRKQREFTDITEAEQARLRKQAAKIGQDTQFTNLDVVKAQTKAMQGLPAGFDGKTRAAVAEGILENVKNYALVMEADLETSAEGLRSYLQSMNKDISTKEKALLESNKAVNQMVKMALLGGMTDEDVQQFVNFAGAPGNVAGLTPESMMALAAVARRAGFRGEKFGVAMRTASSKLVSPTRQGITALNAAGINYDDYRRMPSKMDAGRFEAHFQRELGKGFTPEVREKLAGIFADPKILGDRGAFAKAVTDATGGLFEPGKKGGMRASDAKAVARAAGSFHKVSAEGVDTQRLIDAIMASNMTLEQLNAFFTDKHGGKFAITQQQRDEYNKARAELKKAGDDPDFAKRKADAIMDGLGGALERLKGSVENLSLAMGEANAGWLKPAMEGIGGAMDAFSNLSKEAKIAATAVGGLGAAVAGAAGLKSLLGGFGLTASAAALDGSATALTAAAAKLAAGSAPAAVAAGGAAATGGGLVATLLGGAGVVLGAGVAASKMAGNPLDIGLSPEEAARKNDRRRALEAGNNPGGSSAAQDAALKARLAATRQEAERTKNAVDGLDTTVTPNVESGSISVALRMARELNAELAKAGTLAAGARASAASALSSLGKVQRGNFKFGGVQGE